MTPDQIAKSGSEHGHQAALFAYCAVARLRGWATADAWANGEKLSVEALKDDNSGVPALEWFHAIHNQGHGDKVRGANAKAEGVRKGIADTFLPWPLYVSSYDGCGVCEGFSERVIKFAGLYIEMKKPSEKPKSETAKGGVSDEQAKFGEYAKRVGFGFVVCYSWREAANMLRNYIEWKGE